MKCPKCGYSSFDHLEACKKCGGNLKDHKIRFAWGNLPLAGSQNAVTSAAAEAPPFDEEMAFDFGGSADLREEPAAARGKEAFDPAPSGVEADPLPEEAPFREDAAEESWSLCAVLGDPPPPPVLPRLGAAAVDLLVLGATFALFVGVGNFALRAGGAEGPPLLEAVFALSIPYFLVLFSLCFGYFTFFHVMTGQSPGKMLFGLRVESEDGEPLLWSQAFLRSVGGLLALLCLGAGFVPALGVGRRRGWNDLLAGTRLVAVTKAAAAERF